MIREPPAAPRSSLAGAVAEGSDMSNPQNAQSELQQEQQTKKPDENISSEPTIIAEQHRKADIGPKVVPAEVAKTTPSVPPELPSNPNPSQQSHVPADPMDPDDPNSPNVIEGERQELFPKDPPGARPPNE